MDANRAMRRRPASTQSLRCVRPLLDDLPSDEEAPRCATYARLSVNNVDPIHPNIGSWSTVTRIMRLAVRLQWWLGFPAKWTTQFLRMIFYVVVMLPTLLPHFVRYVLEPRVVKHIPYGSKFRHQLDVYLPKKAQTYMEEGPSPKLPVIVFVTGGAWVIGYKYWGNITGFAMMDNEVIMVCPDYRNFPEVSCSSMLSDVDSALDWVLGNIEQFGGDPANITLMGQSAGAHLTLTLLLLSVKGEDGVRSPFQRYIGVSGPYDLSVIVPTMHERGLHRKMITRGLFENEVDKFDPIKLISSLSAAEIMRLPKEIHLWHGKKDATCPWELTVACGEMLTRCGHKNVKIELMENDTHTSFILEHPLQGNDDFANMLLDVHQPTSPAELRVRPKTPFSFLANIGAYVIPF